MKTQSQFVTAALASALGLMAAAPAASAQHSDVDVRVEGGRLVTGAHDDATGEEVPYQRVFGYDFGEDPLDPFFAGDPGFGAEAGSGLPAGSLLSFSIPSASSSGVPSNLSYWGGAGPVTFAAVPSGETLRFNLGSQNALAGGGTGEVAGFNIATVGDGGTLHRHLNALLNGADGNNDPTDGSPPAGGIYLVPMTLRSSDPSVGASDPIYVVFNNGLSEEQHDAAIEYVTATIVPEPAAAGLAAAASGALLLRRRRDGSGVVGR